MLAPAANPDDGLPDQIAALRGYALEVVHYLESRGAPYASLLATMTAGDAVIGTTRLGRAQPLHSTPGVRLSVWTGSRFDCEAVDRTGREALYAAADQLLARVRFHAGETPNPAVYDPRPGYQAHWMDRGTQDVDAVPVADRLAFARGLASDIRSQDPELVKEAAVSASAHDDCRLFAGSGDRLLTAVTRDVRVFVNVSARNARDGVSYHADANAPGWEAAAALPDRAALAERATRLLRAGPISPGAYTVVLDPALAGVIAHEALGHPREIDNVERNASWAAPLVGSRIGSDLVTIVDYGGYPGTHGRIPFSDDGVVTPATPTVLVDHGMLQPMALTCLRTYTRLKDALPGLRLSANGRAASYADSIYARMTATLFQPYARGIPMEQMIAELDDGIVLSSMLNGMEDPLNGMMHVKALCGEVVRNGKRTGELVREVSVSGPLIDFLRSVDAIGIPAESRFHNGYCGKGHHDVVRNTTGGAPLRGRIVLG